MFENYLPRSPGSFFSDPSMAWGSGVSAAQPAISYPSAAPIPLSGYTGTPDYSASLFPSLQGVDIPSGGDVASWTDSFKGFGQSLKDSGFLGYRDGDGNRVDGWGGAAFSAANGLMSGFLGMKQYGLFKDQLAQSKRQFDLNYEAQKKTLNSHLEDRQRARVASNAGAYQSVGDYMNKNGI